MKCVGGCGRSLISKSECRSGICSTCIHRIGCKFTTLGGIRLAQEKGSANEVESIAHIAVDSVLGGMLSTESGETAAQ